MLSALPPSLLPRSSSSAPTSSFNLPFLTPSFPEVKLTSRYTMLSPAGTSTSLEPSTDQGIESNVSSRSSTRANPSSQPLLEAPVSSYLLFSILPFILQSTLTTPTRSNRVTSSSRSLHPFVQPKLTSLSSLPSSFPPSLSVSIGQGCDCTPWHEQVHNWINQTFPHPDHFHSDGAVGARGSDYFK